MPTPLACHAGAAQGLDILPGEPGLVRRPGLAKGGRPTASDAPAVPDARGAPPGAACLLPSLCHGNGLCRAKLTGRATAADGIAGVVGPQVNKLIWPAPGGIGVHPVKSMESEQRVALLTGLINRTVRRAEEQQRLNEQPRAFRLIQAAAEPAWRLVR